VPQVVLPDDLDSDNIKTLIEAMKKKDPTLITNPMMTFDFLASGVRQPFFAERSDYLKNLWPKWQCLVQRCEGDYNVAALVVLTAYVQNGGLFEVDLDTL